jgi:hypothetical protein
LLIRHLSLFRGSEQERQLFHGLLQVDQGKMPDRQVLYLIELEVWSGIGRLREVRLIPGLRVIKFVSELNLAREDKEIASLIAHPLVLPDPTIEH